MLKLTEFRLMAAAICGRGTSSGMAAIQAGEFSAAPMPSMKVRPMSRQGVITRRRVRTHSAPAAMSIQVWVRSRKSRRSMVSARAPPGSASRKAGKVVAAWMSATSRGESERLVISQPAPMFCIQVPMFETTAAIQSARKRGVASGLQASDQRGGGEAGMLPHANPAFERSPLTSPPVCC